MVTETKKAAAFEREVGKEEGELGKRCVGVRNMLDKEVVSGLERIHEGRGPGSENSSGSEIEVVKNSGC